MSKELNDGWTLLKTSLYVSLSVIMICFIILNSYDMVNTKVIHVKFSFLAKDRVIFVPSGHVTESFMKPRLVLHELV